MSHVLCRIKENLLMRALNKAPTKKFTTNGLSINLRKERKIFYNSGLKLINKMVIL